MGFGSSWNRALLLGCVALAAGTTARADDDDDALKLESAKPAEAAQAPKNLALSVELGAGQIWGNQAAGGRDALRASVDLRWRQRLGESWRVAVSDRLDSVRPDPALHAATKNSLREAFVGWQSTGGEGGVELGRVNQRLGHGYAFSPTDFFREGATRMVTSAEPTAIRNGRLGTVMARGWRSVGPATLSLAVAPHIADAGDPGATWSTSLQDTNRRSRIVGSADLKLSERWNAQALYQYVRDGGNSVGFNGSGLLSDSTVLYAEWAVLGRTQPWAGGAERARTDQGVLGVTQTLGKGVTATVELGYNGLGFGRGGLAGLQAADPARQAAVLGAAQINQDQLARRGALLLVTAKDALVRGLDLSGYVRGNLDDHSRLWWLETRYHWGSVDLALQGLVSQGGAGSEFVQGPYRRGWQALVSTFF